MIWRLRCSARSSAATARCEPLDRKLLQGPQLRQRATRIDLLRREPDAFPQIVDHSRNDKSPGGIHDCEIALRTFDFAAQNSLENAGIFGHLTATQIGQIRSRNS